MIDIGTEHLLSFSAAAFWLQRRGLSTGRTTLYRWASCGVRGKVLETVRLGGSVYTSEEALTRFCDHSNADGAPVVPVVVSARRRRELDEVERECGRVFGSGSD